MFGVSKRTIFLENGAAVLPGPGQYINGPNSSGIEQNDWYKKTFNYRYLKQYHNGMDPYRVIHGMDHHNSLGQQPSSIYETLEANATSFQPRARSHLASLQI
jgi:hypothetical protein